MIIFAFKFGVLSDKAVQQGVSLTHIVWKGLLYGAKDYILT